MRPQKIRSHGPFFLHKMLAMAVAFFRHLKRKFSTDYKFYRQSQIQLWREHRITTRITVGRKSLTSLWTGPDLPFRRLLSAPHEPGDYFARDFAAHPASGIHLPDRFYSFKKNPPC
jgi:hypothetical protein